MSYLWQIGLHKNLKLGYGKDSLNKLKDKQKIQIKEKQIFWREDILIKYTNKGLNPIIYQEFLQISK